jgi:hypothetical protein
MQGGFDMNAFYKHHRPQIRFHYRCFDRVLLNAVVQPFQQPERVVGFFSTYRKLYPVSRQVLRDIAGQFHNWVVTHAAQWEAPILDAPPGRRDEFVARYFHHPRPDQVVVILKAREPARILVSIGSAATNRYHLTIQQRWVHQYNFYINDAEFGRMFVRVCPYFPFSARVCLNQHWWIAKRLERQRIRFTQCANAFVRCAEPAALQQIADSLQPQDVLACAHKWLAYLVPFFTARERKHAGCQHRIFFAQVEYCDNLIFRQRTALDRMGDRLLDANRTIGQPNKLTLLFGRKVTKRYRGKLQTVIEDLNLPNPVMRSHYGNGFIKQYVRDRWLLRTEAASNNVRDYGVPKAIEHLPALRASLQTITDNYLAIQQDILETFVDRGQLRQLTTPTITATGKRIPGLKLDHPRQLALMQAVVRFAHLATGGSFTTADLHAPMAKALGCSIEQLPLSTVRYELSKLRAKEFVEKLPHSRRYQLTPLGYRLCVVFLKLFHKIYAPLAAAIVRPIASDRRLPRERRTRLDGLYAAVTNALDELAAEVGLKAA